MFGSAHQIILLDSLMSLFLIPIHLGVFWPLFDRITLLFFLAGLLWSRHLTQIEYSPTNAVAEDLSPLQLRVAGSLKEIAKFLLSVKTALKQRRVFVLHPQPEQPLEADSYHLQDVLKDRHDWSESPGSFLLFLGRDARNLLDKKANASTIGHRDIFQRQNGHDDRAGQSHSALQFLSWLAIPTVAS